MNKQIQLQKNEQVVLEHCYDSTLPMRMMVIGALVAALGFVFGIVLMMEIEDPSPFLFTLIGVVLIALGNYLKPMGEFLLTVTNKRVVQNGPFGQFVVLPLNRIAAVSGDGKKLNVSSAGGRITLGIPDSASVCNAIAGLLNQLQEEVEVERHSSASKSEKKPAPQPSPFVRMDAYWICVACDTKNMEHRVDCWNCGSTRELREPNNKSNNTTEERAVSMGVCPDCGAGLEKSNMKNIMVCPDCGRTFK